MRYNGGDVSLKNARLEALLKRGQVVTICPEVAGGLSVPRPAAEIQQGQGEDVLQGKASVRNVQGEDVTEAFLRGARKTLRLVRENGVKVAVLKSHSPSCGLGKIYDGSFNGRLKSGNGITAALLLQHGIRVFSEEQLEEALNYFESLRRG